jgi:hypothetical protein
LSPTKVQVVTTPLFIGADDAAKVLGISPAAFRTLARRKLIGEGCRVARRLIWPWSEIEEAAEKIKRGGLADITINE